MNYYHAVTETIEPTMYHDHWVAGNNKIDVIKIIMTQKPYGFTIKQYLEIEKLPRTVYTMTWISTIYKFLSTKCKNKIQNNRNNNVNT